jgi:hypothetical protein
MLQSPSKFRIKVEMRGAFFSDAGATVFRPRLPCIPPRLHQQKPPPRGRIFQNTPQKHP